MSGSVGSVSVEVVPDARNWSARLQSQIRDAHAKVKVDADTEEAKAEIDEAARDRTSRIRVKADTSQLSKGADALDRLTQKLGLLPALAIAGTAALIPLTGALGGVVAALTAPLVIAGGAATLFGFLGLFAVKNTQAQLKNIDALRKKLAGLQKGTAEYAATQQQLAAAQKALSPAQVAFAGSLDHLKSTFGAFIAGPSGQALLEPFTQGLNLLAKLLPTTAPLLRAASGAFSDLLGGIGRATSGPGFQRFMNLIAGQAGHDIRGFGGIFGNIAKGLGSLFVSLDKRAGSGLVDELSRLTGAFADWAGSKAGRHAVQDFLDYFHRIGPGVADAIGAVARATEKLVSALAPLGPGVLKGIQLAAEGLAKIPAPVLTGTAAGVLGLTVFGKAGGFKALSTVGQAADGTGGSVLQRVLGSAPQKVFVVNWPPGSGVTGVTGGKTPTVPGVPSASTAGLLLSLVTFGDQVGGEVRQPPGPVLPQSAYPTNTPSSSGLKSTSTALDAIYAQSARLTRSLDLVGPHAKTAVGQAETGLAVLLRMLDRASQPRTVKVTANTQSAMAALQNIQNYQIKDKTFHVTQYTNATVADHVKPGKGHATGGLITGPGGPRTDSIPTWLSNGEYVVNAAATARNRAALDAMNYGSKVAQYAGSGAAGGGMVHTVINLDGQRIGEAMTPAMHRAADDIYHANRDYEFRTGGR